MLFKEMFKKSITRDIQGVVIAGQGEKTNIATELEEYVVTPELQRHFADFFSAYAKGIHGNTTKMGVWISCLCKRDPWKHDKNGCLDLRLLWKR